MTELPAELSKLSSKELAKVLDVNNGYKAKYFAIHKEDYKYFQLFKLIKRFRNIYIYQDLETNKFISLDSTKQNLPSRLYSLDIEKFNQFKSKNLLNAIPNKEFDLYLRKLASDIFGEDKIDTQYDDYINELIIYFPELVITNSVETVHTMYDIYIRFTFSKNTETTYFGRSLHYISFIRTTFTDIEVASVYQFSHVNSGDVGYYSESLCFGTTPLNEAIRNLRYGKLDILTTVLMSLESYLTWESFEGVPHRSLTNMVKGEKYKKVDISITTAEKESFYNAILSNINNFTYTYSLLDGSYKVKLTKDCINTIEAILTNNFKYHVYSLVNGVSCIKNTNINTEKFKNLDGRSTEVTFKGVIKKLKIIHTIAENKNEVPNKIHRTVLNYIVDTIEQDFYNYLINKKLIEAA